MTKKMKTMEGGGGSEFFVCFTSRPSSSSATTCSSAMRVPSSKTLMSPGRCRDPAASSLSASLSRRLRSSGSVKGGQSPMFPAAGVPVGSGSGGGRKKGCSFEAAEPSSPKVTCIGQVRVKTKKKSSKSVVRSRSQRGAEASFRRTAGEHERACLPNRNQKWVHQLPLSICETLRAFGSEFNCFVPCAGGGRSACSSSDSASRLGEEKRGGGGEKRSRSTSSSCGAVFARWLMAIQESEEGKGREVVGLVVEERKMGEVELLVREREGRGLGLEVERQLGESREGVENKEQVVVIETGEEKDEEGTVSLCIPPKNALLLMRCRSDPVKMAALANRFWSSPAAKVQCEEDDDEEEEDDDDEEEEDEEQVDRACKQDLIEEEEKEAAAIVVAGKETRIADRQLAEQSGEAEELEMDSEENQGVAIKDAFKEELVDPSAKDEYAEEMERQAVEVNEGKGNQLLPAEEQQGIVSQLQPSAKSRQDVQGIEEPLLQQGSGRCEVGEEICSISERKEKEVGDTNVVTISCSSSKIDPISKETKQGKRHSWSSKQKERRRHSFSTEKEARRHSFSSEREARRASFSTDKEGRRSWSVSLDKEDTRSKIKPLVRSTSVTLPREAKKEEEMSENEETSTKDTQLMVGEERKDEEIKGVESKAEGEVGEKKRRELPDCLLLMMYEPKLSMEVSKETWVCSTDFIRWRPHHQPKGGDKMDGGDDRCDEKKNEVLAPPTQDPTNPRLPSQRPPPSAPPTVSAVEEKLQQTTGAGAGPLPRPTLQPYEPFVLTRCKSEPMKSSARLAPDACFWKSRHQPIGAAGIGF